jgi:hypothetical protein
VEFLSNDLSIARSKLQVDGEDFTGAYWYKNTHFSV